MPTEYKNLHRSQPSLSARVEIIRRNPNLLGCRRVSDFATNFLKKYRYSVESTEYIFI